MPRGRSSDGAGKVAVNLLDNVDLGTIMTLDKRSTHAGTKALVTLGPASREVDVLVKLLEAGASCCRVDLTYGSVEYHKQSLRNLQAAVRKTRRLCAVVLDTFGRELVIRREYAVDEKGWPKPKNSLDIAKGQEVVVTTDNPTAVAQGNELPIECPGFDRVCKEGDTLFVGRYLTNGADVSSLYLDVTAVQEGRVLCRAQNDAKLDGLLTVIHSEQNCDGMSPYQASLPLLTARDKRAIADICGEFEVDFVALTYTCSGEDVAELREYLETIGQEHVKIIAKVENSQALTNFEGIALETDAVLLSRGNLGLDVPPEKVAIVQKAAIARCNVLGKPVIITRVVDTMSAAPRCTRAEATDVANAVLDGCDGILLGAETLRGKYPVEAVSTVLGICRQAEQVFNHKSHFDYLIELQMQEQEEERSSRSASAAQLPRGDSAGSVQQLGGGGEEAGRGSGQQAAGKPPRNPASHVGAPSTPIGRQRSGGYLGVRASSFGSLPRNASAGTLTPAHSPGGSWAPRDSPNVARAESMASTAVRAADKLGAKLIIVYASSGRTASLVAKYRPPMPILTLVVPNLRATALSWQMQGRSLARQLLCMRGVIPVMSAPNLGGGSDGMLAEAIGIAAQKGLVGPADHVVCLLSVKDSLVLKVISIDALSGKLSSRAGSSHDLTNLGTRATGMSPTVSGELPSFLTPALGARA